MTYLGVGPLAWEGSVSRARILIVEDQPEISELLQYNLDREGFQVVCARDGHDGLRRARDTSPDLVVLDVMLPGLDGFEVCRQLRSDPLTQEIPVIMLTAKDEESDVVLGLRLGADDYVTKPFGPRELVARIRSLLRRSSRAGAFTSGDRLNRGSIVIDAERHEVHVAGDRVDLTPTEFRLLHTLASHPGRVFNRDQLVSRVIGDHAFVVGRNIDVHVRGIRKKLGSAQDRIETIRGIGYRFRED